MNKNVGFIKSEELGKVIVIVGQAWRSMLDKNHIDNLTLLLPLLHIVDKGRQRER